MNPTRRGLLLGSGAALAICGRAKAGLTLLGAGSSATSVLTSIDGPTTATSGTITGYTEGWVGRSTTATPGTSTISLSRQGFGITGLPATYTDTLTVTQQLRQVYPSQASLATGMYALSDDVYSTDIVDGGACVNNSTFTSPLPVANWTTPDGLLVGNSIGGTSFPVRLTAWHRNARGGKPVACVVFTISDGSASVTATATALTAPGMTGDLYTVQEYVLPTTDISGLADNVTLTINAKVYPWIGTTALDSATTGADLDGFSPRYYRRDTTRYNGGVPPVAYVSSGGNDATGVWSTTPATALATPFLTINGALTASTNASGRGVPVDGGGTRPIDGCEIRLTGTFVMPTSMTSVVQKCARLTITRDGSTAKASAVATFGLAACSFVTTGQVTTAAARLRFYDITLQRTGNNIMSGSGKKGIFQWENVILDPNGVTATLLGNVNNYTAVYGLTELSVCGGAFTPSNANGRFICFRGMDVNTNGSGFNGWNVIGSKVQGSTVISTFSSIASSGSIVAFNSLPSPAGAGGGWAINGALDCVGAVYACNAEEWTSATASVGSSASRDSEAANTTHVMIWNNTIAGGNNAGRCNYFYDETPSAYRSHKLMSVVGNIFAQLNTKSDYFAGNRGTGGDVPASHVGNWAFYYGVGCRSNWTLYADANGGGAPDYKQTYPGLNSHIGTTSTTTTVNNPGFVSTINTVPNAATSYDGSYHAGSGGPGNYQLTSGLAPAAGIVTDPVLAFTLDGSPRLAVNDDPGALSRAA